MRSLRTLAVCVTLHGGGPWIKTPCVPWNALPARVLRLRHVTHARVAPPPVRSVLAGSSLSTRTTGSESVPQPASTPSAARSAPGAALGASPGAALTHLTIDADAPKTSRPTQHSSSFQYLSASGGLLQLRLLRPSRAPASSAPPNRATARRTSWRHSSGREQTGSAFSSATR